MTLAELLNQIEYTPLDLSFDDVISTINEHYTFEPTSFANGPLVNDKGSNEGSCKIFAFGLLNQLSEAQTLACFGLYYRKDVLQHPENSDHSNIRQFIQTGWSGIVLDTPPLTQKI